MSNKRRVIRLEEIGSTNNYLKQLLKDEELRKDPSLLPITKVKAGQMGNGWSSEKGQNLLFSLLIYPVRCRPTSSSLSPRGIAGGENTLDRFTDDIRVKWPNDIYWKERKIAGMLIENDIMGKHIQHSIIGIGININQEQFADELPNPVSLKQITGSTHDRDYILDMFTREFFLLYREVQKGEIKPIEDEYMMDLYRVNEYHWYEDQNGRFQAMIHDVLPSGHLVVKTLGEGDMRKYAFKEIAFVDIDE